MIVKASETTHAVNLGEPGYPGRLALVEDAPETLWLAGAWRPRPRAVSIVGARAASAHGMNVAHAIAAMLARNQVDVISGGAVGIDAAAHRGALDVGGVTVAVLGTGIDVVYPARNAELFDEIAGSGGALLTQFPPGAQPRPGMFPTRNKIIAALAELVVVVEAGERSGSLHTARAARLLGRTVVAVPGSPGTDGLLLTGARAVAGPDDVLAVLEGRPTAPPALPRDPDAARLYAALDTVPRDVGDLAFRAGLAVGTCAAMVVDLELGGLAVRAAGGRYVRLR
jgi:DNA processing protein